MDEEPPLRLDSPAPPSARSGLPGRNVLLAGLAVALAGGLALGVLARPKLALPEPPKPMQPVTQSAQPRMQVLPAVEAPAPSGPPLEVLPPATAAARHNPPAEPVTILPARDVAAAEPEPRPQARPAFDCGAAEGPAEMAVCSDERLAAADRRLARAWSQALEAGAPEWELRRDQRAWLAARDDTAREAPDELAGLYDQRIRELREAAAEAAAWEPN